LMMMRCFMFGLWDDVVKYCAVRRNIVDFCNYAEDMGIKLMAAISVFRSILLTWAGDRCCFTLLYAVAYFGSSRYISFDTHRCNFNITIDRISNTAKHHLLHFDVRISS